MTRKAEFNAEEWSDVIQAPMLAGMMVVQSERGGTVREVREIAKVYAEARAARMESVLLDAIVSDRAVVQPVRDKRDPDAVHAESMQRIRRALRTIDRVATADEANEFRRFIWSIAERTARAHKEGGFLGIGGKEISGPEQAVLDELSAALDEGVSAP